jgi:hypothetical protein
VKRKSTDEAPADLAAGGTPWVRGTPILKYAKIYVGSFGVDYVLLTEGSILNSSYEFWE